MAPTTESVLAVVEKHLRGQRSDAVFNIELKLMILAVEEIKFTTPDRWNLAGLEGFLFESGEYRTAHRDIAIEAELITASEVEIAQELWRREEAMRRPHELDASISAADLRDELDIAASQAKAKAHVAPERPPHRSDSPSPPETA